MCCGDEFAAKMLLLNLASSVYGRKDGMPLGSFNINLFTTEQGPASFMAEQIKNFAEGISTNTLAHKVTIKSMSQIPLTPKKNYDQNKLIPGLFQMPLHTTVVLDETEMVPGKLEGEIAITNLRAITELIESQSIHYNFQYHEQEFQTSCPVTVVSCGRSLFKNSISVPVNPQSSDLEVCKSLTDLQLRHIACMIHRTKKEQIEFLQEVQAYASDRFVEMREEE